MLSENCNAERHQKHRSEQCSFHWVSFSSENTLPGNTFVGSNISRSVDLAAISTTLGKRAYRQVARLDSTCPSCAQSFPATLLIWKLYLQRRPRSCTWESSSSLSLSSSLWPSYGESASCDLLRLGIWRTILSKVLIDVLTR